MNKKFIILYLFFVGLYLFDAFILSPYIVYTGKGYEAGMFLSVAYQTYGYRAFYLAGLCVAVFSFFFLLGFETFLEQRIGKYKWIPLILVTLMAFGMMLFTIINNFGVLFA